MKSNLKLEEQIQIALKAIINIEPSLEIPTAGIMKNKKGNIKMLYNPKKFKPEELKQIMQHEALHYLGGHIERGFDQMLLEASKAVKFTTVDFIATHQLINIVEDHNINSFIKKKNSNFLLTDGVLLHDENGKIVKGTDAQNLALLLSLFQDEHSKQIRNLGEWKKKIEIELYFNKEKYDAQEKISFDPPKGDGKGKMNTDSVSTDTVGNKSKEDKLKEKEVTVQEIKKSIEEIQKTIEEIDQANKESKNKIPGGKKGEIDINFTLQEELKIELEDFLVEGFNDFNQEIRKTEVRKSVMGFFGRKAGKTSRINLICDVSGSMVWDSERMDALGSALASINKSFYLSFFDVGMTEDDIKLTSSSNIEEEMSTVGGGGTELLPAVQLYQSEDLLESNPTIIITDGELWGEDLKDSIEILREYDLPYRFVIINQSQRVLDQCQEQIGEDKMISMLIK